MKIIRIALLEDEPIDQIKIEMMLDEVISHKYEYKLSGVFDRLEDLFPHIDNQSFDVIISDIFSKDRAIGIELLEKLRNSQLPIILITQSQDKSLFAKVQQVRNVHYLIKPFHAISLHAALESCLNEYFKSKLFDFLDKKFIYLSGKSNQKEKILFEDIIYLEAEDSYCYIFTESRKYAIKKSLSKLLLEDFNDSFLRIHHKYAINKFHLKSTLLMSVTLSNMLELPIGKSFKKSLREYIKM